MSSRPFMARFPHRCAAGCDEPQVAPGDMTDDGLVVHQHCDDEDVTPTPQHRAPDKCPTCNLLHVGERF